jgi:hypothetical protein
MDFEEFGKDCADSLPPKTERYSQEKTTWFRFPFLFWLGYRYSQEKPTLLYCQLRNKYISPFMTLKTSKGYLSILL